MDRGVIISGIGHVAVILWAVLGGWLFTAQTLPEIQTVAVETLSEKELQSRYPSPPSAEDVAPTPVAQPVQPAEPVTAPETQVDPAPAPEPAPTAEPAPQIDAAPAPAADPAPAPPPDPVPETLPEAPKPQPEDVPPPLAPPADLPQPQPTSADRPKQRPVARVAETAVDDPPETPRTDDVATPAVSDTPTPDAQPEPPDPEAQPEETVTEITPDANDQVTQLAPTASQRPKSKPIRVAANPEAPAADAGSDAEAQAAADAKAAADKQAAADAKAAADKQAAADAKAAADKQAAADAKAEQDAIDAAIAAANANVPKGPPMSSGEIDALRVSIKKCWSTGTLSTEASRTVITVQVSLSERGVPDLTSMRMTEFDGGPEAAAKIVFTAARSAITRCGKGGFPLPPEKYQSWKDLELVFDPRQMQ